MSNFIDLIEDNLNNSEGLRFIEQAVKLLFSLIANAESIERAELPFKNLEDLQFVLVKAIFKNNLTVTSFLREFVYDFDRIDDFEVKKYLYQKIQSTRVFI